MLTLEDGIRLRDSMFADEDLLRQYDLADKMSGSQTKHGRKHAFDVVKVGCQLMDQLNRLFPGMFSPWEREVLGPIAFFGHDIGRSVDAAKHDRLGAAIIGQYLKHTEISPEDRRRICWAIRNHRADRCLALEFDDKLWAILVIADKCVGDAERVRGSQAIKLELLKLCGLARRSFVNGNEDHRNNVVNYAIKRARIDVDRNDAPDDPRYRGAIVLNLDLDEGLVTPEQVLNWVEWFRESWHACGRACQYLGFVFRIEFNGARWFWNKEAKDWKPLDSINVPRA